MISDQTERGCIQSADMATNPWNDADCEIRGSGLKCGMLEVMMISSKSTSNKKYKWMLQQKMIHVLENHEQFGQLDIHLNLNYFAYQCTTDIHYT